MRFVGGSMLMGLLLLTGCSIADRDALHWRRLANLPDQEGFASTFSGVSGGALIVAGGSNFPDKKPWDGGRKVWYDRAFVLNSPDGQWCPAGQLPRPLGYGVSVSIRGGVLCAGGGDAQRHYADVFLIHRTDERLDISTVGFPALPAPCAFMAGALVGDTLYIAGGIETPAATQCSDTFSALDVNHPDRGWQVLPPCPGGGRILAVAASEGTSFYLFSGARLSADAEGKPVREYLRDAWRYSPGAGWSKLADLPRAAVAAASPAPRWEAHQLLVISGDDGTRMGFKPETAHPGFARSVLAYDTQHDRWTERQGLPFSRATVPAVRWNDLIVIPSGEARPGYRTPEVWALRAGDREGMHD